MIRNSTEGRSAHASASRKPLSAVLVTLLAASLLTPPAWAQTTEDMATARSLATEANKKKAADPKGAIDLFSRAFALAPSPSVRLETGRLHLGLGELIEAEADFREAMSVTKKGEPAAWKDARTSAADELTKLDGRAPFVVIKVPDDIKANVKVFIDGKPVPAVALGVRRAVNPGKRTITAEAPTFKPVKRELTINEKQVVDVALAFEPDPNAVVAPPPGTSATSSAAVVPPPPPTATTEPPPPPPPTELPPQGKTGYGLAIFGFTTGGVLMGLGGISGLLAKTQFDAFKSQCVQKHCPPDKKSEGSRAEAFSYVSTGGFALGGAFVVVGVVGLFTGGRPIARTGNITPGYDGQKLFLQGSF